MRRSVSGSSGSGQEGFGLVLVIWGLGLIALMALAVITSGRQRVLATANLIENAKAEALAEAGVNLLRLELHAAFAGGTLGVLRFTTDGMPVLCTMPQGAFAALAVEDEGGKADLNTASPQLVAALLRGFGAGAEEADRLAKAIADFPRAEANAVLDDVAFAAYAADGRPYGPKQAPFVTVLELDQVIGMQPDLLRAVLPYVTVHSRKPGVDARVAAPALLGALAGLDPASVAQLANHAAPVAEREAVPRGVPPRFLSPSSGRSFLARAEIRMPGGGLFVREAIVEWPANATTPQVREWRRGRSRSGKRLDASMRSPGRGQRALPPC